jgi:small GTP-binding protein
MSDSANTIIKYFSDRFLELNYYPTSIKAVLDLSVNQFKGMDKETTIQLEKKNIKTIRDLAGLSTDKYHKLLQKLKSDKKTLKNIYIASILISNSWNQRKTYLSNTRMKVVVAGLDYAGKTSLIKRLLHNYDYYDLTNIEPTVGANVEEFHSKKLNLILWDLGGQKRHIDEYLEEPEKFFIKVDVLIYVIDSQDDVRYEDSLKYLNDLINILSYLDEFPYVLVLLNKADTDLQNNSDFQIKFEYIKDKLIKFFENQIKSWNVEIIPTSIHNFYSNKPEIAQSIKAFFSKETQKEVNTKIPEIQSNVQKILDLNLKFMEQIMEEVNEMKRLLIRISPAKVASSITDLPFQGISMNYQSDKKVKKLKNSHSKQGVPKPMNLINPNNERLSRLEDELKDVKLKNVSEQNKPPTAQLNLENHSSLNPPKDPSVYSSRNSEEFNPSSDINRDKKFQRGSVRQEIINELKDLFIRKGITD